MGKKKNKVLSDEYYEQHFTAGHLCCCKHIYEVHDYDGNKMCWVPACKCKGFKQMNNIDYILWKKKNG